MVEKFTALLCHAEDKDRIVEIRTAGGMSEKDTISAIIAAVWPQKDKIIAGLKATKVAVKAAQIAHRSSQREQMQALMKAAREKVKTDAG